jgi:hypothetical protein
MFQGLLLELVEDRALTEPSPDEDGHDRDDQPAGEGPQYGARAGAAQS